LQGLSLPPLYHVPILAQPLWTAFQPSLVSNLIASISLVDLDSIHTGLGDAEVMKERSARFNQLPFREAPLLTIKKVLECIYYCNIVIFNETNLLTSHNPG